MAQWEVVEQRVVTEMIVVTFRVGMVSVSCWPIVNHCNAVLD